MPTSQQKFKGSFACVFLALAIGSAPAEAPKQLPLGPAVVSVRLRAENAIVSYGQPVRLQVAYANDTNMRYRVRVSAGWRSVLLVIRDAEGRLIEPGTVGLTGSYDTIDVDLAPHSVRRPFQNHQGNTWLPLSDWGYGQLPIGRYTICAIAKTVVNIVTTSNVDDPTFKVLDTFVPDRTTPNSNTVSIKIR